MVKNFWYAVATSKDIQEKPVGLKRFDHDLVFWRDSKGAVQAMDDRCFHRRAPLSMGRVKGDTLECPFHGFRYDGKGACTLIPANGVGAPISKSFKVKSYPVREHRGLVWLWWGDASAATERLPWFEEFNDDGVPYIDICKEAPISFCRMMENNMDFAHFAFVHKRYFTAETENVYAKEFRTWTDGPRIDMEGKLSGDPSVPAKKKDLEVFAAVIFPNMAKYDSPLDRTRNQTVVWVAPVDEKTCWFTFRVYLAPGRFLGIRKFLQEHLVLRTLWLKWVYLEDLRIWTRQNPADNGFKDVLPCTSDGMIREYLRMYRKHSELDAFDAEGERVQNLRPAPLETSS